MIESEATQPEVRLCVDCVHYSQYPHNSKFGLLDKIIWAVAGGEAHYCAAGDPDTKEVDVVTGKTTIRRRARRSCATSRNDDILGGCGHEGRLYRPIQCRDADDWPEWDIR